MFLDSGRKQENPEEAHTDMVKNMRNSAQIVERTQTSDTGAVRW